MLFSITMVCFFALFGMLVVLLRQAKAEGAMERARTMARSARARERAELYPAEAAPFENAHVENANLASEGDLHLNLSTLVPRKQPDWRFMVRDRRGSFAGTVRRMGPRRSVSPGNGSTRPDWAYYNADLGDLDDPQLPISRRA